MKTLKQLILLGGMFALMFTLSGCLETTDVTFFEPGIYKGSVDPLIGSSNAATLQARFEGQMDR